MTLDSGDRIFFDVTPAVMVLQTISLGNLDENGLDYDGPDAVQARKGADSVYLHGRDVALFLHRLTTANADGCVVAGEPGSSMLRVQTLHDELGRVTVVLETDRNVIHMKAYERDMLVDAVRSRAWRLFL